MMAHARAERSGFTLVELIVVMAITALLSAVLLGTLLAQLRLARLISMRVATSDAVRTTVAVVGGELRRTRPEDVRAVDADSLAVRSFRGLGFVCDSDAGVLVRYRGDRLPDPTKDSVLIVHAVGQTARLLLASEPAPAGACAPEIDEFTLRLEVEGGTTTVTGAAAVLVFESGSYYLTSHALRYRLGREGRQPLTAEWFLHPGTAFHRLPDGTSVGIGLRTVDRSVGPRPLPFSPQPPGIP